MRRTAISFVLAAALLLTACSARPSGELPEPEYTTPASTPEPEATPSPTPEPPEDEYFTISMVGDCTLSSSQREDYFETVVNGDMSWPFSGTKQYFEDDYLTIANLECSLSHEMLYGSATFTFCGDAENAEMLVQGGVDFVTLGNNHTMDFGQTGLDNTKGVLEEYGVAYAAPDASCIYEADGGITVGLYAAPWTASQAQVVSGVGALANNPDVDIVICLMHWGIEGSYRQNSTQTSTAYAAINAGADIVYGSHPHVLQPIEEYNGGYIVYSLGNYVFGGNTAPRDRDTAIVQFTVKRSADGSVSVEGWEAIPCSLSSTPVTNDFRPEPYEEGSEEYERAMSKLNGTFTGPDLVVDYSEYEDEGEAGTTEQPAPSAAPEDGVTEGEDAVETE